VAGGPGFRAPAPSSTAVKFNLSAKRLGPIGSSRPVFDGRSGQGRGCRPGSTRVIGRTVRWCREWHRSQSVTKCDKRGFSCYVGQMTYVTWYGMRAVRLREPGNQSYSVLIIGLATRWWWWWCVVCSAALSTDPIFNNWCQANKPGPPTLHGAGTWQI